MILLESADTKTQICYLELAERRIHSSLACCSHSWVMKTQFAVATHNSSPRANPVKHHNLALTALSLTSGVSTHKPQFRLTGASDLRAYRF